MEKKRLIIISGPSGVGKDLIAKSMLSEFDQLSIVVSVTDREPRADEIPGESYFFVYPEKFQEMIEQGEFLEWKKVHQNFYGTPRDQVDALISQGQCPLLVIDVKGTLEVKKRYPQALLIFIKYDLPSRLIDRLKKSRPETSNQEISIRMNTAREEMKSEKDYDYSVVNPEGKPQKTIDQIKNIIVDYLI